MTQLAIEAFIRQKIGLDATVFADGTLAKAVQYRMAKRGISETSVYLNQLYLSVQELEALIEAVIVPETWFFRDKEPFMLLQTHVHEWARLHPGHILRILSAPCSTGEEPYSIAISLFEAGLSADQFQIDAVDISRHSLQRAQAATYDKHSFRGTDSVFQQRYFTQTPVGYFLCETIRHSVRFQYGNVIDRAFAVNRLPYDIIFCRNLLIYFDSLSRQRTIQTLHHLLNSQGLLFVGHAETALLPVPQFIPVRHPFAFAYRKVDHAYPAHASVPRKQFPVNVTSMAHGAGDRVNEVTNANLITDLRHSVADRNPANIPSSAAPQLQTELEIARHLANQGHLPEAAQQCQIYLTQNRTSAEAYTLLGQVYQAMGQELQAEQCFQKALYLNPKHPEALMHLALLLEQQGNLNRAATLRQRIQRLI